MSDKVFVSGLFFNNPSDKAPEYVKGKLTVYVDQFYGFLMSNKHLLKEDKNGKKYIKIDMKTSQKDNKMYFEVDTWEPLFDSTGKKTGSKKTNKVSDEEVFDVDSLPF